MKKRILIFILIFLVCIPMESFAGFDLYRRYWRADPSFQIMPIDKDSPIIIEKGNIVFDFPEEENRHPDARSLSSWLRTDYNLYNPTDEMQNIQIALPVISILDKFNPKDISINVDGRIAEFNILIGEETRSIRDKEQDYSDFVYDFGDTFDIKTVEEYIPKNYNLNDIGILYTYIVNTAGEDIHLFLDYKEDREKSYILDEGFSGAQYRHDEREKDSSLIAEISTSAMLSTLIIGEDVEFEINAFLDRERKKPTKNYIIETHKRIIFLEDYFDMLTNKYMAYSDKGNYLDEEQIKSLILESWDEIWGAGNIQTSSESLISTYMERIIYYTFDVEFPANGRKHISIDQILNGTIDNRKTLYPVHQIKYNLTSLERWADLGQISIEIDAPKDNPYVIESNVDFTSKETGFYTGNFDELPVDELSFSLYYKEKISRWDGIKRFLYNNISLIGLLLTLLIAGIKYIIRKHKKKPDMDS